MLSQDSVNPANTADNAADAIKAAGRRVTVQRAAVMDAIREIGGHAPVDRIVARLRESHPQIDIATVYRTVDLLGRLHIINEVRVGDVSHYEYAAPGSHHGHMVCEHCGETFHLPPEHLRELRDRLRADAGFDLHAEHLTLSGLCRECVRDVAHSHSGHSHAPGRRDAHARGGVAASDEPPTGQRPARRGSEQRGG